MGLHRSLIARASLLLAIATPSLAHARPDSPGTTEIFRYDEGDVIERHGSAGGSFLVHYTRAGINRVPSDDADSSGVPDHVERVAEIYDEVLAFYRDALGFRAPLDDARITENGGDERFDVYLLDFAGRADGTFGRDACGVPPATTSTQCIGFMVQENDFAGYGYPSVEYANRLLASHELFHGVQAAYDASEGSVLGEGTAVWASEAFDPSLEDLESFAGGYLDNTDRPIDRPLPGPVDPFSYGAGIFFRFLEERFETAIIRALWEASESGEWLVELDAILARDHGSSFAAAFRELVEWNLYTGRRADPTRSYEEGAAYPLVAIEAIDLPLQRSPLRVFYASAQYFGAAPAGRAAVRAELVGDAEGLELVLAVRRGDVVELAPGEADTAGADEVIAIVLNPARAGESRRPGLCIGSAAELDACRAALSPAPDAGTPISDAGTPDAGTLAPPPGGCGCRAVAARDVRVLALLPLLLLMALRKRAR